MTSFLKKYIFIISLPAFPVNRSKHYTEHVSQWIGGDEVHIFHNAGEVQEKLALFENRLVRITKKAWPTKILQPAFTVSECISPVTA